MYPCRIHFAVADEHRQDFANCFSGNLAEINIECEDVQTGATWWAVSGAYDLLQDVDRAQLANAQAWYCCIVFNIAGFENPDGLVLDSNCGYITGMPDPGFDPFLAACGLRRVPKPIRRPLPPLGEVYMAPNLPPGVTTLPDGSTPA